MPFSNEEEYELRCHAPAPRHFTCQDPRHTPRAQRARARHTAAHREPYVTSTWNRIASSRLDVDGGTLTNHCRIECHQGDVGGVRDATKRRPEPRRGQ